MVFIAMNGSVVILLVLVVMFQTRNWNIISLNQPIRRLLDCYVLA